MSELHTLTLVRLDSAERLAAVKGLREAAKHVDILVPLESASITAKFLADSEYPLVVAIDEDESRIDSAAEAWHAVSVVKLTKNYNPLSEPDEEGDSDVSSSSLTIEGPTEDDYRTAVALLAAVGGDPQNAMAACSLFARTTGSEQWAGVMAVLFSVFGVPRMHSLDDVLRRVREMSDDEFDSDELEDDDDE
jgi:hypothetical protein